MKFFTLFIGTIILLSKGVKADSPPIIDIFKMHAEGKTCAITSQTGVVTCTLGGSPGNILQFDGTNWVSAAGSSVAPVQSVFGRVGAVTAQSGDYSTSQVTEAGNLYFTNARAQAAVSATPPLLDTAGVFSMPVATTNADGYLSAADWTTFNNKQSSGSYLTALTGDVTASGPGSAAASLTATTNGTITTLSALSLPYSQITGTPAPGANTALSNLSSTAVNVDIVPATDNGINLGTDVVGWENVWTYNVQSPLNKALNVQANGANLNLISTNANIIFDTPSGFINMLAQPGSAMALGNGAVAQPTNPIVFYDSTGTHSLVGIGAPSHVTSSTVWLLPPHDGSSGQVLSTDGASNLSWTSVASIPTFTQGSVLFANSSGNISQDNSNFYWDDTNHALGIGTAPASTTVLDVVNNSGSTKAVQTTGYGASVPFRGRYANGTLSSPTAVVTGNNLAVFSGRGYGATGFAAASTGAINMKSEGGFTDSSMPTAISFNTTPSGSVTSVESLRLSSAGNLLAGTQTDSLAAQIQSLSATQAQLSLKYDLNNFTRFTVDSTNSLSIVPNTNTALTGGNININSAPAEAVVGGIAGIINILGGAGSAVGSGGNGGFINITGGNGQGDSTISSLGGNIVLTAGNATGASNGAFTSINGGVGGPGLTSGAQTGAGGGAVVINGGMGGTGVNGSAGGGVVNVTGGPGASSSVGVSGAGGGVTVAGGNGALGPTTGGSAGGVTIKGGVAAAMAGASGATVQISGSSGSSVGSGGAGGTVVITGGSAGGDNTVNRAGGGLTVNLGSAAGSSTGGAFVVTDGAGGSGTAGAGVAGGGTTITSGIGGAGSATSGNGGAATIAAGAGGAGVVGGAGGNLITRGGIGGIGSSTSGGGGTATLTGGAAAAAAGSSGGSASVTGAAGSATGSGGGGGAVSITAGAAGGDNTVNNTGGTITITAGVSKGSSIGGAINGTAGAGGLGTGTLGAAGGAISWTSGAGGAGSLTSGTGGGTTISSGAGGAGVGGGTGGGTTISSGIGGNGSASSGNGGLTTITSGAGGASSTANAGNGGGSTVTSGVGGASTSGAGGTGGGSIISSGIGGIGTTTSGAGGSTTISSAAGGAGAVGGAGGASSLTSGAGGIGTTSSGNGGGSTISSGAGGTSSVAVGGAGGASAFGAGNGGSATSATPFNGGTGGATTLTSGTGGASTAGNGGNAGAMTITPGAGGTGAAGTGGNGGALQINAGLGGTGGTAGAGGAITFRTAATTAIATRGTITAGGLWGFGSNASPTYLVDVLGGSVGVATIGQGYRTKEGAGAKQGVATLAAGTVTVANANVTATSRIFVTIQSLGTVVVPQPIGVTARTAGTSFTITSATATDTSVVAWEIFEPY